MIGWHACCCYTWNLVGPITSAHVGFMQMWWVTSAHPSISSFWTGGQAAIATITASLKNEGVGRTVLFHSQILICESNFGVRPPRSPRLRVRGLFRNHSLLSLTACTLLTTQFPLTNAESRVHSWWNINNFGKLDRLEGQASQLKKKKKEGNLNRMVEEKRRKLGRASPRTMERKEDLWPRWSLKEEDAWVVFSIDDFHNEAHLWGLLEDNNKTPVQVSNTCISMKTAMGLLSHSLMGETARTVAALKMESE